MSETFTHAELSAILDSVLAELRSNSTLPAQGQRVNERGGSLTRNRFQSGSLKLEGRSWVLRWRDDVVDSNGQVRRVRRSKVIGTLAEFPTRKLALRRRDLLMAKVNSTGYRPSRVALLDEFVERWKAEVLCNRKPSTQMASGLHLRKHILPELGKLRMDEITVERQQMFVSRLTRRVSRKTLLNILGTLSSVISTALSWGYLAEAVNRRKLALPSRTERSVPRFFTVEEIQRIVAAAPEPLATVCFLAVATGMREGELFGLTLSDLDFERRTISVRRSVWRGKVQSTKGDASVRVLHMPDALAGRLKRYIETKWRPNPMNLLFYSRRGTPLNPNHLVSRKLHPVLVGLGIGKAGLHAFRHSHSSMLVDLGAPVTVAQAQLGHAHLSTTLGVYTHVLPQSQQDAVERLVGILDGKGRAVGSNLLN